MMFFSKHSMVQMGKMANYSIVEQTVAHLLFVYCVLYVYLGTMGMVKQAKSNKKAQTHTNAWRNVWTFVFVCGRKKKQIQSWNKRKKWLNSRKMHSVWKFLWSRRKTIFIFLSLSKTKLNWKKKCIVKYERNYKRIVMPTTAIIELEKETAKTKEKNNGKCIGKPNKNNSCTSSTVQLPELCFVYCSKFGG